MKITSIAVRVIFLIVVAVTLVIGALGAAGYHYFSNRQWTQFQLIQRTQADQFKISVEPAVWGLNLALIRKLMESPLQGPHVLGVEVRFDEQTLRLVRQPDGQLSADQPLPQPGQTVLVSERQLEYEGQKIGEVRILVGTAMLEDELRHLQWMISGLVLLVDLLLSLLLYVLLRPLVLSPLKTLEEHADRIASGHQGTSSALGQLRFSGELDSLRKSLNTMFSQIEERDRDLMRYRDHLEELVETRTEELDKTYQRLRETEFAMNQAGILIQWIDAERGDFLFVNDRCCELFGVPREDLLGHPAADWIPAFSVAELARLRPELERGEARLEVEARTRDGGSVPLESVLHMQLIDGRVAHYITFSTDISQRMAVKEALLAAKVAAESAARTRSEFLANMSHEIRTPMNAIIGMSQLALRTEQPEKQRNYLEKVHRSAVSLLGILNDILDFSKVEAGQLAVEQIEFRLDEVLNNLCNVIALKVEEKNLELLLDIAPDVPERLVGDPMRLGQILVNLAGNAIKFTDQGAVVVGCSLVSRTETAVTLAFQVRDSGIGMSEEQLSRLFTAFSQADSSITRRFGGTGLGLAICKRLVELFDGEISASSQLGQGSTFRFTACFGVAAAVPGGSPRRLPVDLSGKRVLVVDDNAEAREIFTELLGRHDLRVDEADSARAALDRMRDNNYDLLICDWKMPEINGVQLIRQLQQEKGGKLPCIVVMVSAYGVEELRQEAGDLHVAAVLAKPVTPSLMFDAIVTAFGRQSEGGTPDNLPVSAAQDAADLAGYRVLLVEDNPINQELANDLLVSAGLEVTIANHGGEALELLANATFDAVLMDVQMPVMDGLEAARRIRREARWRDLPIIAMTAGAMAEEREQTLAAGMNAHITKPIDVDEMFRTLATWLIRTPIPVETPQAVTPGPAYPGLDIDFGLKSAASKPLLYRKLLRKYLDSSDKVYAALTQARAGFGEQLARQAHSLKGSAGTLGLHDVYQSASALEKALDAGDTESAGQLYEQLLTHQACALDSIGRYLAEEC